eukprot:1105140-Rhodomonas_salina.1
MAPATRNPNCLTATAVYVLTPMSTSEQPQYRTCKRTCTTCGPITCTLNFHCAYDPQSEAAKLVP